jgi:competence protein ComEC
MANQWSSFPIVRVTIAFIVGALICHFSIPTPTLPALYISLGLTLFYTILVYHFRKSIYKIESLLGVLAFMVFAFLGFLKYQYNDQLNSEDHFSRKLENAEGWIGLVSSPPREKTNFYLYQVTITNVISTDNVFSTIGTFNFYVRKDSTAQALAYGDIILVPKKPFELPSPKNPNEFNYAAYMRLLHVQHQQFVDYSDIQILDNKPKYQIIALGYKARIYLQETIQKHIKKPQERAVISALLIGEKDQLDRDIIGAYSAAGAMHVLAVSGLHVGIVYLVLLRIFSFLKKRKRGKWLLLALMLTFLWSYAMVTGFSPSVLRAVTMFSLVILAETATRKSNIYNTIALSALLLLIYEPNLIFSVGFQLSYAAVLGIIYIQPKIYNLWLPNHKGVDWFWGITAVSIAAQIATFPLGLYYFHQFPTFFIFSNLIVIPAVAAILYTGLVFLIAASISSFLGDITGFILELELWFLNQIVIWTEQLPGSLLTRLYIDFNQLLLLFGVIFVIILIYQYQRIRFVYLLFVISLTWAGFYIYKTEEVLTKRAVVHFMIRNQYAIDINDRGSAALLSDSSFIKSDLAVFQIDPYRMAHLLPSPISSKYQSPVLFETIDGIMEIWYWNNQKIVRLIGHHEWGKFEPIVCNQLIIANSSIIKETELKNFRYDIAIIDNTFKNKFLIKKLSNWPNVHDIQSDGSVEIIL